MEKYKDRPSKKKDKSISMESIKQDKKRRVN